MVTAGMGALADAARRICETHGIDYDAALAANPRWWEEPGDYEVDGVLHDAKTGRAKEVVYENGVAFPILTAKQARSNKRIQPTNNTFSIDRAHESLYPEDGRGSTES